MNTLHGGFPHDVSATDIRCTLLGSCLKCRGASAIWFVTHWWHLTSSTLISVWPCCTPGPWMYLHMMLCVWWWMSTKAEKQWPAGEDRRVALATSSSTRFRRMPTLCYLRCGDLRSSGSRSGATVDSDYATTTMMMKDVKLVSKMEGKTNFSRHLQAVRNRDCWVFENRRRIGCNLKLVERKRKRKSPVHISQNFIVTVQLRT